ncbi:MAG: recombination protein RecR [Candidatus Marinimicrobia bacterium]|nr:recombination protein RecR [Candidatus Neomarinimicrobiota bacterium]|tara:strand:+ start:3461 stop:4054 length:594 start_codon:yes stop_codon:yes gene_type:complete
MYSLPESANKLIDEFAKLPGIGRKTAQRLTFFILKNEKDKVFELSNALLNIKEKIIHCSICFGITENDPCAICKDTSRNKNLLCVVENAYDIIVFEKTNGFKGKYHVLGGVLSPLDGIGPDDLRVTELIQRIKPEMEIILAMNPNVEGETTSLYLAKILSRKDINISRLARGIPVGSDLGYIDSATLTRAMEGRTSV